MALNTRELGLIKETVAIYVDHYYFIREGDIIRLVFGSGEGFIAHQAVAMTVENGLNLLISLNEVLGLNGIVKAETEKPEPNEAESETVQ